MLFGMYEPWIRLCEEGFIEESRELGGPEGLVSLGTSEVYVRLSKIGSLLPKLTAVLAEKDACAVNITTE